MTGSVSSNFSSQALLDIRRITGQLSDLQRQVASGAKANDLLGFGSAAGRLLSAQSLKATADSHISVITQMQARFGIQSAALGQVANATGSLSQSIREAISANDGRGISTDLSMSFSSIVSALNETWNGQPLFAGDRLNGQPVKVTTLDALATSNVATDVFDEAARHQIIDLGSGTPITLADKASEMATPLFDTLKSLNALVQSSGGAIGNPITETQRNQLLAFADQLDAARTTFNTAEGKSGQLQSRFDDQATRLTDRSNLLTKEIGEQADADPAQLSVQINALLTQYQAAAKTFADLSKLSLLQYL